MFGDPLREGNDNWQITIEQQDTGQRPPLQHPQTQQFHVQCGDQHRYDKLNCLHCQLQFLGLSGLAILDSVVWQRIAACTFDMLIAGIIDPE